MRVRLLFKLGFSINLLDFLIVVKVSSFEIICLIFSKCSLEYWVTYNHVLVKIGSEWFNYFKYAASSLFNGLPT